MSTTKMEKVELLFQNNANTTELNNNADIEAIIEAIDAAMRITGQSAIIIDFDKHKLIYRTENLIYIDEANKNDYLRQCPNPYWSLVSEETLGKLVCMRDHFLQSNTELPMDVFSRIICNINYPIQLRGHELYISQQFTPLLMRSDGITKVGLIIFNPSNLKSIESGIFISGVRRFRFDFAQKKYIETDMCPILSNAEKVILNRARMGYNINQIAQSLFISPNTVKTHRRRIFNKLKVKSITEALAVIDNSYLI